MSTDLSLERAIQALRNGDRETASALLHEFTQAEPLKPEGWLWLAAAQNDPIQKRVCLQQALALDPNNHHAAAGLRALDEQTRTAQQLGSASDQMPPSSSSASSASRLAQPRFATTGKRARRISWPLVALIGALVILIPLALWLMGQAQSAQSFTGAWAIVLTTGWSVLPMASNTQLPAASHLDRQASEAPKAAAAETT